MILPPVPGTLAHPQPALTQLCTRGYTTTIRPPVEYTNHLKRVQLATFARYHADRDPHDYEEDHLIPLELGGSPRDPHNLWPEPWPQADRSDPLENALHRKVCGGAITLRAAQFKIRVYKRTHG